MIHSLRGILCSLVLLLFSLSSKAQCSVNAGNDTTVCQGALLTRIASTTTSSPQFQWYLSGNPGNSLSTTSSLNVNTSVSGTFTFVVKVDRNSGGANCPAYDTIRVIVNPRPTASFDYNPNSGCPRRRRKIKFNSTSSSNGGGNLSYQWNFGDPNSGSNNTSNDNDPEHSFVGTGFNNPGTFTVTLTVTTSNGCSATTSQVISLGTFPDATLIDTVNFTPFATCNSGVSLDLTVNNASITQATNTAYQIIWGDLSPNYSSTTMTNVTHTYPQQGYYTLTFIVSSGTGCKDTSDYRVFLGSNPGGSISSPSSTYGCTGQTFSFPFANVSSNTPGTEYVFVVNDGTDTVRYTQETLPAVFTHTFDSTSCGTTSNGIPNTFMVTYTISNPCGEAPGTIGGIRISKKPKADFSISPKDTVCVNNLVTFTSTGIASSIVPTSGNGPCIDGKLVWDITPSTGWTLSSGILGSTNNQVNQNNWTAGSNAIVINFTTPGVYNIRLRSGGGQCGVGDTTKTICVNPTPTASFTLSPNTGCAPLRVNASGSTNTPTCGVNTYRWTVSYAPTNGCVPNAIDFAYVNGTSATSQNPQFSFISPGVYTIGLQTFSPRDRCSSAVITQTVTVKGKPTVTLSGIPATLCQNVPITPSATATCYIDASTTYAWAFSNATPSSSTLLSPGSVLFNSTGNQTVALTATNSCGPTIAQQTVNVLSSIAINQPSNQTVCNGNVVSPILFSGNAPGAAYFWTNNNTSIGLAASGTGNIPPFTAVNTTNVPAVATITVTSLVNGCSSNPRTFTITVNPNPFAQLVSDQPTTVINGEEYFFVCSSSDSTFTFYNNSFSFTPSTTYNINWGDGTSNSYNQTTFPAPLSSGVSVSHNYLNGIYALTFIMNNGGCIDSVRYKVYVGNIPSGGVVGLAGSTICAGNQQGVVISGTASNTAGTIYTLTYNDGTAPITLTAPIPDPDTLYHRFDITSCGTTSTSGGNTYANAYGAYLTIQSPCGNRMGSVVPIYVASAPVADFTTNTDTVFVGQSITFTNTGNAGQNNVNGTCTSGKAVWQITPNTPGTRYLVISGSLGSIVTANPTNWISGSNVLNVRFDSTGVYTIRNIAANNSLCGRDTTTRNILVKPAPPCTSATIPNQTTAICSGNGFLVLPTNAPPSTVVPAGTTYTWSFVNNPNVTGDTSQAVGQTSISQTLTNMTNVTQTVVYTVTPKSGTCTGVPFTVTVSVYAKPAIPSQTAGACSGESFVLSPSNLPPNQIVPVGTTYTWTVLNNTNVSGEAGQTIPQSSIGQTLTNNSNTDQSVSYTVSPVSGSTGGCTGAPFILSVSVFKKPLIPNQSATVCSGGAFTISPINNPPTTVVPTGVSYTWTVVNNPNVSGDSNQFTPQSLIRQTLTNTTNISQTVVYTVTPFSGTCIGQPFTVTVTVNPTPTVLFSSPNQSICSGQRSQLVNLTSSTPGVSFSWTASFSTGITGVISSGSSTIPAQTLTNNTNTAAVVTYSATAITSGGQSCSGVVSIYTITVAPTIDATASNQTICSGTSTNINITTSVIPQTAVSYTHTPVSNSNILGGFSSTGTSIQQALVNVTSNVQTLTYNIVPQYTSGSLTCLGNTRTVSVTVNPNATIPNQSANICGENSFSIAPTNAPPTTIVPAGTQYVWSVATNPNVTGQSSQTIPRSSISQTLNNNSDATQSVEYLVTPSSGTCVGTPFSVLVTINPTPKILSQTITNCSGIGFVLTPTNTPPSTIVPPGTTYTWTVSSNNNLSGFSNQTTPVSQIGQIVTNTSNTQQQITYNIAPKVGTCLGQNFTLTVTILPKPTRPVININGNREICDGDSVALVSSSSSGYQWFLYNNLIPGANNQTYVASASGSYAVITNNSAGCKSDTSSRVDIVVNPVPTKPIISLLGNTLTSSFPTGNQWYFNGQPILGATAQNYIATNIGAYSLVVTINGCSSETSDSVYWSDNSQIEISVTPTPAQKEVEVNLTGVTSGDKFWVSIFDSNGRVMLQKYEDSNFILSILHWPNGVYYIRVNSKDGKKYNTGRILKTGM